MREVRKINPLKAVMLARVSSKNQEEGHSLDAQGNQILSYADKYHITIIKQFRIVESSTKGKRPEFKQMLGFVKASKEKLIILVYNADRLHRDFDECYIELRDLIKREKTEVHFTSTGQKMTAQDDSVTKFRNTLDIMLAGDYANRISDNVKRTNHEKRSKGTIGHDSPLGYLNLFRNKETHKGPVVEIDEKRAPFAIKAFEMYASGAYSVRDIVKILGKEGFTQKKGGKPVTVANITSMLTNRFYYGEIESYKYDMIFPHVYPTLISKELFDKCQEVRLSRGRALGKAREEEAEPEEFKTIADQTTNTTFIFKGTTRCKECNCIYSPELKTKRVIKPELKSNGGLPKDKTNDDFYFMQEYTYLRPLKKGNGCTLCEHIREDCIEAQVINAMEQIHIPEDLIKSLKPDIEKELSKNTNYHKTRLSLTEEKLAKLKSQKENLL